MSSYRRLLYHIVIRTKYSHNTINQKYSERIYAYITGIIRKMNCHMYRINGIGNHIHVLTDIHHSLAPIDFVRDVKANSSGWMKKSNLFPRFVGWSEGYGIFTCSNSNLEDLINYVKTQQEHHRTRSFEEEYRDLLREAGIDIDERFFL